MPFRRPSWEPFCESFRKILLEMARWRRYVAFVLLLEFAAWYLHSLRLDIVAEKNI